MDRAVVLEMHNIYPRKSNKACVQECVAQWNSLSAERGDCRAARAPCLHACFSPVPSEQEQECSPKYIKQSPTHIKYNQKVATEGTVTLTIIFNIEKGEYKYIYLFFWSEVIITPTPLKNKMVATINFFFVFFFFGGGGLGL